MKQPKVLVGCPTSFHKAYCLKEYVSGVKKLTYPNYEFLLIDNSPDKKYYEEIKKLGVSVIKDSYEPVAMRRIVKSRNALIKYAQENNFEYFLSLEQDVIPPEDIIERLLSHKKDVVTGIYSKPWELANGKKSIVLPLIWNQFSKEEIINAKKNIEKIKLNNPDAAKTLLETEDIEIIQKKLRKPISLKELEGKDLMRIFYCGLGCILIKTSVFDKIKFRFNPEGFDDMTFCIDLIENNIPLYADANARCDHLVQPEQWKNVGKLF